MSGVGGFILSGYVVGLPIAVLTFLDVHRLGRGAFRTTGRRRRHWESSVVLGWLVLGWGAVLVAVVWFAGEARRYVRQSLRDHHDEREIDLALEERKAAIARERVDSIDLNEASADRD